MGHPVMKTEELLENMALQFATQRAEPGLHHGSRVGRIPVGCWQARLLADKPEIFKAMSPQQFREAMENPDVPVIFLPREAVMTLEVMERICHETPLNKMVIWEDG
jgi:hypothetical protein